MFKVPFIKALVSISLVLLFFSSKAQEDSLSPKMSWIVGSWIDEDSSMVETWVNTENGFDGWVYKVVSEKNEPLQLSENKSELLFLKYVECHFCYVAVTPQHNNVPVNFSFQGIDKYTYSFENIQNDFPKWIIYQRVNNKTIQVILKSEEKELRFYYFKIEPKG